MTSTVTTARPKRNDLCRVIATKPSGLALIQLGCGCCEWAKPRPDGTIHHGRRAAWCGRVDGEGPAQCVAYDLENVGARFTKAAAFIFSPKGRELRTATGSP